MDEIVLEEIAIECDEDDFIVRQEDAGFVFQRDRIIVMPVFCSVH